MRSRSAWRPARLPAIAFFATLACALAAPSESRAGCDAHLAPPGGGPADPLGLRLPGGDPADPSDGMPRPCSGPSCSRAPEAPPAAPAAEVRFSPQWACLGPLAAPAKPAGSFGRPPAGGSRPIHAATSIFHPPRPDSAASIA